MTAPDDPWSVDDPGAPMPNEVAFRGVGEAVVEPMDAAADLVRHVRTSNAARSTPLKARPHRSYSGAVTVRVSWQGDRFHTIKFSAAADGRMFASHKADRALALLVNDWLAQSDKVTLA